MILSILTVTTRLNKMAERKLPWSVPTTLVYTHVGQTILTVVVVFLKDEKASDSNLLLIALNLGLGNIKQQLITCGLFVHRKNNNRTLSVIGIIQGSSLSAILFNLVVTVRMDKSLIKSCFMQMTQRCEWKRHFCDKNCFILMTQKWKSKWNCSKSDDANMKFNFLKTLYSKDKEKSLTKSWYNIPVSLIGEVTKLSSFWKRRILALKDSLALESTSFPSSQ